MNSHAFALRALFGCVILGLAGCDRSSSRGGENGIHDVQRDMSRIPIENESKVITRESPGTAKGKKLLESLHALTSEEFDKRLKDDNEIQIELSKIDTDAIELLLTLSGFNEKEEERNQLFNLYCKGKAEMDPKAYVDWLTGAKKDKIVGMISFLARRDPEMAAEVVTRSDLDSQGKSAGYGQVFEGASALDPERSVQVMEATKFENSDLKNNAMIAVITGVNRETITPPMMARIMSGFSETSLNSFPQAVGQAGGAIVENPVETVLAEFPLSRKPWERVVAVAFLETKAYRGFTGDSEIMEFLKSEKAKLLTDDERGRLHTILGK